MLKAGRDTFMHRYIDLLTRTMLSRVIQRCERCNGDIGTRHHKIQFTKSFKGWRVDIAGCSAETTESARDQIWCDKVFPGSIGTKG